MATVSRADTGYIVVGTVRISGITVMIVLGNDVIRALCFRKREFALSVSYPDAQLVAAQTSEHHAVVLRNAQRDELTLELVAVVMQHLGSLGTSQTEFHHQLATVTDTQRQGVLAGIELVEGLLSLGVEEEGTSPSLGRTQYVGVRETAAEHNHVDVLKGLATGNQVGHHHVLHVETGQIQAVSHLTLTIGTLLADDGCLRCCVCCCATATLLLPAVSRKSVLAEHTREVLVELHLDRLLLVVLVALLGLTVEALLAVEQVAGLVPDVTQRIDVELVGNGLAISSLSNHLNAAAVFNGISNFGKAHALFLQKVLELLLVVVTDLNDHTRILCEESLHYIRLPSFGGVGGGYIVQVDVHTALGVGEAHLQQGGDQTTGRDVVTGHDPTLFNHLLNSHEGIGKVLGVLHRWHVAAYLA